MKWLQGTFNFTLGLYAAIMSASYGCAQSPATNPVNTRTYTIQDPTIQADVGEEFSIILVSNPTTGYSWKFSAPLDDQVIELTGDEFLSPDNSRKGAPGQQLWTFRAVGEGKTTISLEYVRPWEKGKEPARTMTFTVIAGQKIGTGNTLPSPK